ncbi:AAA family ATPase [Actinoplanes sp. NPDC051861]|uniref:ATP-binding protein n=1 Tax=Actinoplanes sp. NPDC051861 TaxID=3155170 RepID=UPI003448FEC1
MAGTARGALRLQILGPLRIWRDGAEIDPGPRQQACLLAALLSHAGRPLSTTELTGLIWEDDAPATAQNIIQKYVGTLRHLLEPGLTAREPGSYLLRHNNGYLFRPAPGVLDLTDFRDLVTDAGQAAGERALDAYIMALDLWHGPAAAPAGAGLDGEFLGACVAATEVAVALRQPGRVLAHLRRAAAMAPLHEPVQASLVLALGTGGQQAEALSQFAATRTRLADELGVRPGPELTTAHQRVLTAAPSPAAETTRRTLVGRADEARIVRQAVDSALSGGTGLVLVEGEPGVGKTRLLEEAGAGRPDALVVWGRCLAGDGTPSMWPWTQAVKALLGTLSPGERRQRLDGELGRLVQPGNGVRGESTMPDGGAQFRLFEQVAAVVAQVAARRPTVLIIDDLQWADGSSLQVLSHLAARLPRGAVLIGALRNRAPVPGSELTRLLAAASRVPGHRRIRLGPLAAGEVAELVRRETGRSPSAGVARRIHARTAGNPFFVRELSRLLATDQGVITVEAATRAAVPATVRDVVRDRMTGLGTGALALLQLAAIAGRDVEIRLLARAADLDAHTCLAQLEPAEALGLLDPAPGDPFSVRFAHDLVRESVIAATPPGSGPRLHLRLADALEQTSPDAERLAHHLWAAGPLADPARTALALVHAGSSAAAKSGLDAAERQLRSATQVARTAGLAELELSALKQLAAVVGMRSLYGGGAALDLLERAEHLARRLGREREAADFLFSRWAGYAQTIELDRATPLAQLLFEQGEAATDPTIKAYGLMAWGIHQWDMGNIGQGVRHLDRASRTLDGHAARRADDPLRHDLQMLPAAIYAEMTAQHGDLGTATTLLDTLEAAAGDDPYMITVWASMAARTAANAGDPVRARQAAERGIAVDPEFSFVFQGTYLRLARNWARAMTGEDPAGAAARMEQLITNNLLDPAISCVATWFALLGEAHLAAGRPDAAAAALDRADWALDTFGQRYPEGLVLLIRAHLLRARGEPGTVVRAAAERARSLSEDREAHLYARRAGDLLRELDS